MSKKKCIMFKNKGGITPTIYDDAFIVYTLRDVFSSWTNGVIQLRDTTTSVLKWIYFDINGQISLNSLVGASATAPDSPDETLSTWIGSNSATVRQWTSQNKDNTYTVADNLLETGTSSQPQFITSGTIVTKNGEPTIDFLSSTRKLRHTSAFTELDSGNSFTALTVSNNNASNSFASIFSNTASSGNRILMYNDRRTFKRGLSILATSTVGHANMLAQDNTSNQRLLSGVVDGSLKTVTAYKNGSIQDSGVSWGTTYTNDYFQIGVERISSSPLNGTIQEVIIFPTDKTADLTDLQDDINTYYSIY